MEELKEMYRETIIQEKLKLLSEKTGYPITQRNGQRVYGPPPDLINEKPPKGSEIFVGRIPRSVLEDELVAIFSQAGRIYELRLMMDFSGCNRGFCFVSFCNKKDAERAVHLFHGHAIRPGKLLGVYKSVDNCRLFVGGLPKDKKKEDIVEALRCFAEGVVDVILYPSHYDSNQNRGFAFVEFENHRLAAIARRQFSPGSLKVWGTELVVDWADPLPDLDPTIMAQVTNLYIRNLCAFMSTHELRQELSKYIPVAWIDRVYKVKDYAFLHFKKRREAELALALLDNVIIADKRVEVSWARPKIYSKNYRMNIPPVNFCTSVPPRMRKQVKLMTGQIKEGCSRSSSPSVFSYEGSETSSMSSTPDSDFSE